MTRLSAPSSSRTFERMCLAMKNATCSSSFKARHRGLGEQDRDPHLELRRVERDGESPAEAEISRGSIPEISFGKVSQVMTTCLCASIRVLKR